MTLPPIIYCQDCHKDGRQTPATWALPDPRNSRKADFYCNDCVGTEIDDCETIEAWRKMVTDDQPAAKPEALPAGVSPKASEVRFSTEPTVVCRCGKPFRHRGRCKGVAQGKRQRREHTRRARPEGNRQRVIDKTTPYTAPELPKPKGNGHIDVGGFKARVLSLAQYKELLPARNFASDLDPIVEHTRKMKPGTVTLWDCPKGKSPKLFRDRLARVLQQAHKLKISIETRVKENAVAVIMPEAR